MLIVLYDSRNILQLVIFISLLPVIVLSCSSFKKEVHSRLAPSIFFLSFFIIKKAYSDSQLHLTLSAKACLVFTVFSV